MNRFSACCRGSEKGKRNANNGSVWSSYKNYCWAVSITLFTADWACFTSLRPTNSSYSSSQRNNRDERALEGRRVRLVEKPRRRTKRLIMLNDDEMKMFDSIEWAECGESNRESIDGVSAVNAFRSALWWNSVLCSSSNRRRKRLEVFRFLFLAIMSSSKSKVLAIPPRGQSKR